MSKSTPSDLNSRLWGAGLTQLRLLEKRIPQKMIHLRWSQQKFLVKYLGEGYLCVFDPVLSASRWVKWWYPYVFGIRERPSLSKPGPFLGRLRGRNWLHYQLIPWRTRAWRKGDLRSAASLRDCISKTIEIVTRMARKKVMPPPRQVTSNTSCTYIYHECNIRRVS